jgi:hypothetical protein
VLHQAELKAQGPATLMMQRPATLKVPPTANYFFFFLAFFLGAAFFFAAFFLATIRPPRQRNRKCRSASGLGRTTYHALATSTFVNRLPGSDNSQVHDAQARRRARQLIVARSSPFPSQHILPRSNFDFREALHHDP